MKDAGGWYLSAVNDEKYLPYDSILAKRFCFNKHVHCYQEEDVMGSVTYVLHRTGIFDAALKKSVW